MRNLEKGQG